MADAEFTLAAALVIRQTRRGQIAAAKRLIDRLRCQSAAELRADLRRLKRDSADSGHSAAATPVEAVVQPASPAPLEGGAARLPRRWKIVVGAAALVLTLAGTAWFFLARRQPPLGPENYVALTNFADSATSPALSPDGRMLTFIRGENTFQGPGEIYVKMLPGGEPKQLTHDGAPKMDPGFSPTGDSILYANSETTTTWTVPVLGGQPHTWMGNAEGVHWIAPGRVMFSEGRGQGIHMGVVTADESRNGVRDVYVPEDLNGMAHRSALSPDGKWVLIVEMDLAGWLPCRMVPFDGSSHGRQVGPAPGQCTSAAWTPDGKWMYFSANNGNGFHIWRQRFPDGAPERVTFGATDEQGISFAPDGKSFVTSIGSSQSTIWIHDDNGDRQVSSEGFGFMPSFSRDGHKLYYLVRSEKSRHFVSGELWEADLESGETRPMLKDFTMEHYDVSADGKWVLFVATDAPGHSPIWLAALDNSSPPRKLTDMNAVRALFGVHNDIYFVGGERGTPHLYHLNLDGSGLRTVVPNPVTYLYSVHPDGKYLATWVGSDVIVYAADGSRQWTMCRYCGTAGEENRGVTPPMVSWSRDQKFVYLHFPEPARRTVAVPLTRGEPLPALPADGIRDAKGALALPGARLIPQARAFGGVNPFIYAFPRVNTQRNIYRIPVR